MSILDYEGAKKRRDYTSPLFSRKNVLTLQPLVQTCVCRPSPASSAAIR